MTETFRSSFRSSQVHSEVRKFGYTSLLNRRHHKLGGGVAHFILWNELLNIFVKSNLKPTINDETKQQFDGLIFVEVKATIINDQYIWSM